MYIGDGARIQATRPAWRWPTTPTARHLRRQRPNGIRRNARVAVSGQKRVPEDVSIVGVDDSLVDMVPRLNLTTMKLRFDDIGATAFSMVRRQCEGEKIPVGVKTVIPPELIERGSVLDIS